MTDPEALEAAAKNFLFGSQEMPSTRRPTIDPLDAALGLGKGIQAKVEFQGALAQPRDMTPRLAPKRQQPVRS